MVEPVVTKRICELVEQLETGQNADTLLWETDSLQVLFFIRQKTRRCFINIRVLAASNSMAKLYQLSSLLHEVYASDTVDNSDHMIRWKPLIQFL